MERTIPLSNLQLELLKIFSMNIDEHDLVKIKSIIARYFAEKAISSADKSWETKKYSQKDADDWLTEHK